MEDPTEEDRVPLRLLRRALAARPDTPQHEQCEELRDAPADAVPLTPEGCQECLEIGASWVHLRMCLTCGHVGCCDTGDHRHARVHAEQSHHPVMRSFEQGESWRWCYVHEQLD